MSLSEKESSALVATHAKWLTALVRGLTRCEADAEDAFQEVWMRVFSVGGLKDIKSERAYLATVARSVVIDRYRLNGRYELSLDEPADDDSLQEELADTAPTPSERAESVSAHEDILRVIRSLPRGQREVVMLRLEGELTFQEISEELNVPMGTVTTWMRMATHVLKRKLKERYGRRS